MDNSIVISTPPHVKSKRTTRGIMLDVCIALLPCAIAGIVYFGWLALMLELVAVVACVATEFVYYFIANKGFANKCKDAGKVCVRWWKQFDFTSVVTGLILALIIPATAQWYTVLIGSIFAIAIVKMLFGGTGKNLVNPAAAGRVFMAISFTAVTTYTAANFSALNFESGIFSGATNLSWLLSTYPETKVTVLDLFLGTGVAGCIGETCKLAIIVGYIYLCVRKVIKWWQPLLFIATFGFAAVFMSGFAFIATGGYIFDMELFLPHLFSGGVLFGAVFMFTDYVTSPKGVYGQIFYYAVAGILVAVLRYFTKIEVTSFVIMLMNLFVPLIDKYLIRKPFGYKKVKKVKEKKTPDERVAEAVDALKVDENAAAKVSHGDSTENTEKSPAASVQSVGVDVKSDKEEA
ncbi:MAG: RnfABCDGE type electron transport complex subunit D [Clostridia bacterium]|nr:RnfABCDGE type electron transport complex subunit D [Clostridia bacterium]